MPQLQPRAHPAVQILESGNIAFFYRPKEGVKYPTGPDDLERAYFMLFPDDQTSHQNRNFNLAHGVFPEIVPGKALPEERDWAFVDEISRDPRQVVNELEKNVSGSPPPGSEQRARPYSRIAGDGRYAIARHKDHTHLVYFLHEPREPGKVQHDLEIKKEASYIISIKDPFTPSEIRLGKEPNYPKELRDKFNGHGWIPCDPTSFLDYLWTQILLIGARSNVERELGITLDAKAENRAEREALAALRQISPAAQNRWRVEIFEPMQQGRWE